jgi:hypothetical protein
MTGPDAEDPGDEALLAFERALGLDPLTGETEGQRKARRGLEARLAPLGEALDPVRPSSDLFSRIAAEAGIDAPLAGFHIVRHDEGGWKRLSEGVDTRTLWRSEKAGRRSFLIRIQPGAVLHAHEHGGDEECLVLEGDMIVDGVTFGPGDYHVAFAGTRHPVVTTKGGCICLIATRL